MNYVLQWLSYVLMWIAGFVAQIFPEDPFMQSIMGFQEVELIGDGMSMLNWFLPFSSLKSTLLLVAGCILSLYALKLIKWLLQFIDNAIPI